MKMGSFRLEKVTKLPTTVEEAWTFFSDPANLAVITPPEMHFRIKTKLRAGEFYQGMQIEYTVRPIAGIPVKWVSEITDVEPYRWFTDRQLVGPYASWNHKHEFRAVADGVEMRDVVDYSLPFGILGKFANWVFVRGKLERIFNYREKRIRFLFNAGRATG